MYRAQCRTYTQQVIKKKSPRLWSGVCVSCVMCARLWGRAETMIDNRGQDPVWRSEGVRG